MNDVFSQRARPKGNLAVWLYFNVFLIATCGLIYELLAGTLASYVLGDHVTQFSLVIGVYLSALGVGAWISGFVDEELAARFIDVEYGVALLGGWSAPILFLAFANFSGFSLVLYGIVLSIGILVGLELPLLMRILSREMEWKEIVSRALAVDYIGALAASILFPICFVPRLGLVRTSLLCGLCNAAVGLWGTWLLSPQIQRGRLGLRIRGAITIALLAAGLIKADSITQLAEDQLFIDPIIYAKHSPYQRIIITKGASGFHLFLNGNLQFSSVDEYRYHEALVHPALSLAQAPRRVVILGGGDGLALREVFRYPSIEHVTLVDLDPEMTALSSHFPLLAELNEQSLKDPRLEIRNEDAFLWVQEGSDELYDAAIVDFPDPNNFSLGKLYTTRFYRMLKQRLTPDAPVAVQCTSPLLAPKSYWCTARTMQAAGFHVIPYHAAIPSFGEWGFLLASSGPINSPRQTLPDLKFLNPQILPGMFEFPEDMKPREVEINRLDNQVLVRYYDEEWGRWD